MTLVPNHVVRMLDLLRARSDAGQLGERLAPGRIDDHDAALPTHSRVTPGAISRVWARLKAHTGAAAKAEVALSPTDPAEIFATNIENFIGTVRVPVGVVGPLRVNGVHAHGDFFVPLATTEAALVASYARGADVARRAGGVSAAIVSEGVIRTPAFVFRCIHDAGLFVNWVAENAERLRAAAEATTRHGKLISVEPVLDSDTVFLLCRYMSWSRKIGQDVKVYSSTMRGIRNGETTPVYG